MANLPQGQQTGAVYWIRNAEPVTAVINDQSDANYVGSVGGGGITGLDSPEIRENAQDLVEAHGGVHGPFWAGRRPVVIDLEVLGASVDAREVRLDRLLRSALNQMGQDGQLIWFPGDASAVATTRENLIQNPNFAYDTAGAAPAWWSSNADAGGWTGTTFLTAAGGYRVNATKDNSGVARTLGAYTPLFPVTGGATYSAGAALNIANTAAAGFGMQVQWWDANGTYITLVLPATLGAVSGVQALAGNALVAPSNAAYARVYLYASSSSALDVVDYTVDNVQFVQEATLGTYGDGDTANWSWLGVPGQSTSVNRPNARMLTTRVQQPPRVSGQWLKSAQVPLVAADPRIYSTRVREVNVTAGVPQTVENSGRTESPPQSIRINGPGTSPTVSVQANGVTRSLVLTGLVLTAGQYVDIFPLTGRVVDQSGASKAGSIVFASSTWWGIMPGPSNVLSIAWVSGNTAASTMRVRWSDAWL